MANALFTKLWWNFRTFIGSLLGNFIWNKYYKKLYQVIAKGNGASHIWRRKVRIREVVEHNIWWQIKIGRSSFWFDNWTKLGTLYFIEENNPSEKEI